MIVRLREEMICKLLCSFRAGCPGHSASLCGQFRNAFREGLFCRIDLLCGCICERWPILRDQSRIGVTPELPTIQR